MGHSQFRSLHWHTFESRKVLDSWCCLLISLLSHSSLLIELHGRKLGASQIPQILSLFSGPFLESGSPPLARSPRKVWDLTNALPVCLATRLVPSSPPPPGHCPGEKVWPLSPGQRCSFRWHLSHWGRCSFNLLFVLSCPHASLVTVVGGGWETQLVSWMPVELLWAPRGQIGSLLIHFVLAEGRGAPSSRYNPPAPIHSRFVWGCGMG